jgi:hypothetical protein
MVLSSNNVLLAAGETLGWHDGALIQYFCGVGADTNPYKTSLHIAMQVSVFER